MSNIPNFWPLVFEQAPPEIDQYIQPSDSAVFAACLTDLTVSRFEIPSSLPSVSTSAKDFGQPRSIAFRFEFAPNEWFDDKVIEKRFWYRRAKNGWSGRVSEPVKINWKKGKDLTDGLLDAAFKAFKSEEKSAGGSNDVSNGKGKRKAKNSKEYETLKIQLDATTEGSQSFFTWFGYRGPHVTAEESVEASTAQEAKRSKYEKRDGSKLEEDIDEDEDDDMEERFSADAEIEIFPDGEELAISLAEDLWPSATKYFVTAQEADDMSNSSFEDMDEDEMSEGDEIVDIRSIVKDDPKSGGGASQGGPPAKKRRV